MGALQYAVDVGGTKIAFALVEGPRLLATGSFPTAGLPAWQQLQQVGRALAQLAKTLGETPAAVGLSVPGPVLDGVLRHAPNMPEGWRDQTVESFALALGLGLPVFAQRDALMGGLGEYAFGAGSGRSSFAYLTLGTGIGGGLILEGQPLLGASGAASEIGHLTVSRSGPLCGCGRRGCVEAIASGPAIAKHYLATSGQALDAGQVAGRARQGDQLATAVYRRAGEALGVALAAWAQVANPQLVVVGGSLAQSLDLLQPAMERELKRRAWAANLPLPIVAAELGGPAPLIGAAWAAHQAALGHL
ncbi:MAG: ROK family protein [Sulfobacillus sp.]